jgi:S1-C subfamily serine protease
MGPQTFASSANPPAFSAQAPVRQVSWPANNARPAVSDAALLAASVRIRVEDATGFSCGSGTIIDYQPGGEALVLTCGHLFRDSAGKGRIAVDTFGPTPSRQVPARLITYDMNRDLGLIAFRPQGTVTVAHVAPSGFQVQPGDAVASVGCNKGDDPTVRRSSITRINRFQGPANFSVAGQPVEGRSGGGLFTNDGLVIGVCNAADPGDQEGLFAALRSIQEQLDERALTPVYRQRAEGSTMLASATVPLSTPAVIQSMPSTSAASPSFVQPASFAADASIPSNMPQVGKIASADAAKPGLSPGEQMALEEVRRRTHEGAEVVIIMRNRQDPQAKSEVFTVDRASPAFVEQLSAAGQSAPSQPSGPRETALEIPKARTPLLEWDREKGWQHRMDAPPN